MHLLFDLDGTLSNPLEGIARSLQFALKSLGLPEPLIDDLRWCIGPPIQDSLTTLIGGGNSRFLDQALQLYRKRYTRHGMFENQVYPGVAQALLDLHDQGHSLILATAKPEVFARRIIDHFDLTHLFDAIYGSQLDGTRKDKGDLIGFILEQENIEAEDTIMIGDRGRDMEGALRNRVQGLGVLWGFGTRLELVAAGAGKCIATPEELAGSIAELTVPRWHHEGLAMARRQ